MKNLAIINVLNSKLYMSASIEDALQYVECFYGIKHSYHEETGFYVLNYDQIKSSKHKFEKWFANVVH